MVLALQVLLHLLFSNVLENILKKNRVSIGKWKNCWSCIGDDSAQGSACPLPQGHRSSLAHAENCDGCQMALNSCLSGHLAGLWGLRTEFSALEMVLTWQE